MKQKDFWYGVMQGLKYEYCIIAETEEDCLKHMKKQWYWYRKHWKFNEGDLDWTFRDAVEYHGFWLPQKFKWGEPITIG